MSRTYLDLATSLEPQRPELQWVEGSFRKILVVLSDSPTSMHALRTAISLAWQHDAELWALSVEARLSRFPATVGEVEEEKESQDHHPAALLNSARDAAERRGVRLRGETAYVRGGSAALTYTRHGDFDLVVIGCDRHQDLWHALTCTSGRMVRGVPCSVMVVR